MFNNIKSVLTIREVFDARAKKYSEKLTIGVISDHSIATEYAKVSGNATRLGIKPDSFSVFKRIYSRKKCMISGFEFDAQNRECRLCTSTGKIIVVNTKVAKLVDEYIKLFDTIDIAKLRALFK